VNVPDLPPRVLLDLAQKCNLRCPMCVVWGRGDAPDGGDVMDVGAALKVIGQLDRALLQPNLWSEPLLVPDFLWWVTMMKNSGHSVAFNTNGLALDGDTALLLVSQKVDSVMFSIDAVTSETLKKIRGIRALPRIEAAVLRLLAVRGEAQYPRIGVSFAKQKENEHEVDEFVRRWVGVVDVVRVGLLFADGTYPDMVVPEMRTPCPAIYSTMAIHVDGQVSVCCLDGLKQTNMGNVFKDGVKGVWSGPEFRRVRQAHESGDYDAVPFCKNCNGWAQNAFEDQVEGNLLIRRSPEFTYYNRVDRLKNWTARGGHECRAG